MRSTSCGWRSICEGRGAPNVGSKADVAGQEARSTPTGYQPVLHCKELAHLSQNRTCRRQKTARLQQARLSIGALARLDLGLLPPARSADLPPFRRRLPRVSRAVAALVVDFLEAVDVEERELEGLQVTLGARDFLREALLARATAVDAGDVVGVGLLLEAEGGRGERGEAGRRAFPADACRAPARAGGGRAAVRMCDCTWSPVAERTASCIML